VPLERIEVEIKIEPTTTPDPCHHDIFGMSKGQARSFFKKFKPEDFIICDESGERHLTLEDLVE